MTVSRSPVDTWAAEKINIRVENLSEQLLEEYQLKEVRKLLYLLKSKSSFYRELLQDHDPEGIRTMADFRRLPMTCEADLAGQEWRFQCVDASMVQRIVTVPTTGTTGLSKRISFTREDLGLAMDFAPYGFAVMCAPGDKVLVMMSGGSEGSIGDNIRRGIEPLGMEVHIHGQVGDLEEAAQCLLSFRPDVIVGIPLHMAALQRYMQKQGYHFQVKSVLLSADDVPEEICKRLRRGWNCHTFRHYGMTEVCMFGAVECMGQCGYHLRSCDHLYEVIDPDENGFGEIAVTTFHHTGMPLLRYRTGDIGKMTTEVCACQSPLMRIETIRGRKRNSVQFPNGRVFLRDISEAVFSVPNVIDMECAVNDNFLQLLVKTLPGDTADLSAIRTSLEHIAALKDVALDIKAEILCGFSPDRHTKKKLAVKNQI